MRDERGFDSLTQYHLKLIKIMHYWQNPSITKTQSSLPKFRAKRPKGLTDAEWEAMVAEALLNKQLVLNCVPKAAKKEFVKKDK